MSRQPIGILGGMGPGAGVYFKQLVVSATPATQDQEHIPMVLYTNPQIPDRSLAIATDTRFQFISAVCDSLQKLEQFGVSEIFIPCNTSFVGYNKYQNAVSVPIYHLPNETVRQLDDMSVGETLLLATQGTYDAGVYNSSAATKVYYPEPSVQALTHALIMAVKASDVSAQQELFQELLEALPKSVKSVVLGCTELSMLADQFRMNKQCASFLDPLELAADYIVSQYGSHGRY